MTATAKVFMSGNSQAIRLPCAFRLESSVVKITRTPKGLLITDEEDLHRRAKAFAELQGSCLDFPEIEPNSVASLPRDME